MWGVKRRTVPVEMTGHPPGAMKIIVNETMERFTYYGMRTILSIVLLKFLPLDQLMTEQEAQGVFHQFAAWNYFFPLAGAIVADVWLGKYRTILYLSLLYTVGCVVLALDQSRNGIYLGLALIAIGSGGIKPSVSACLGDQYGEKNKHLIDSAMAWFYRGINFGALVSVLLTPILLDKFGPQVAFGVPAVGMFLATVVFWSGRKQYTDVPAKGLKFLHELRTGLKPVLKLVGLFLFMSVFFALYDQSGSEWVIQASKMDLNFLGLEWLPSQVQIINPILIVIFAGPIESKIFPLIKKLHPSDMIRVAIGFFLTAGAFAVVTWIEARIESGAVVNIGWQILAFVILTVGEIMAYMSVLQISYRKAMPSMKSFVSAVFLLAVALGNWFTSGVNFGIQNEPPSFVADQAGTYKVTLTASDGTLNTSADVLVTALNSWDFKSYAEEKAEQQKLAQVEKQPLQVSAGRMRAVLPNTVAALYGEANEGDEKGSMSYEWVLEKVPKGASTPVILNSDRRLATIIPNAFGEYVFRFTTTMDNTKASETVTIGVTRTNLSPVVDVKREVVVRVGDEVELSGNGTYDPNGDELTYQWDIVERPSGSAIASEDIAGRDNAGKGSWLKGSSFYLFFTVLMSVVAIAFIPFARKVDLGPDFVQG